MEKSFHFLWCLPTPKEKVTVPVSGTYDFEQDCFSSFKVSKKELGEEVANALEAALNICVAGQMVGEWKQFPHREMASYLRGEVNWHWPFSTAPSFAFALTLKRYYYLTGEEKIIGDTKTLQFWYQLLSYHVPYFQQYYQGINSLDWVTPFKILLRTDGGQKSQLQQLHGIQAGIVQLNQWMKPHHFTKPLSVEMDFEMVNTENLENLSSSTAMESL